MRGPVTQFLLVAVAAGTTFAHPSAQDTGKPGKGDHLEQAVRNYQERLTRLEAVLKKKLSPGSKAAARAPQAKLKSVGQATAEAARRQQEELTTALTRLATLQKALTEASSENLKLSASLKSQARKLAAQEALTQSALQSQAATEARLKTQATAMQRTANLETLLAATRSRLRIAEEDLDARLSKAESALSQATMLIAENLKQARLLAQANKRKTDLAAKLKKLRKELATGSSELQKPAQGSTKAPKSKKKARDRRKARVAPTRQSKAQSSKRRRAKNPTPIRRINI